jgi:3'-phosphoadenosine 5'-phosphosulfate sulfotransferase (PAPS reductase)/FAD synthetase
MIEPINNAERDAWDILDRAADLHNPSHLMLMFSGGHDSLCSSIVASRWNEAQGLPMYAIHINTGVGIERTRQFVRQTCQQWGWRLKEYRPPEGHTFRDFCLKNGMPGPGAHRFVYISLKDRAISLLIKEHKTHRHDRIMLSTGVRSAESKRRMGYPDPIRRDKVRVWVNPLMNWGNDEKAAYMQALHLPRNPVVDVLHMSGECLCGAFASERVMGWELVKEKEYIRFFYPDEPVLAQIEELERECERRGLPSRWGERPPAPIPAGQANFLPLCQHCENWGK